MKRRLEIAEPTLLVDEKRCRRNIEAMALKARSLGLIFRPHFKTHQSLAIGRWFRDYGVDRIAVSSVAMAEYFAGDGWEDITIAFPAHPGLVDRIGRLARRVRLNLLFDAPEVLRCYGVGLRVDVDYFIEVDTGQERSGVHHSDLETIERIVAVGRRFSQLHFKGFLTHAGQVYRSRKVQEVKAKGKAAISAMAALKERYSGAIVSYGDTPTATLLNEFPEVDELRPGNFVFYDLMQVGLGVCGPERIVVALACPVVSVNYGRNRAVIHGGAVHLSKEGLVHPVYGRIYGQAVGLGEGGLGRARGLYVVDLTQEHGVIAGPGEQIKRLKPGATIAILPVHSCLAAQAMAGYLTFSGRRLDHARAESFRKFKKGFFWL